MLVGQYHHLHGAVKVVYTPSPKLWACYQKSRIDHINGKLRFFAAGTNKNRAVYINLITGQSDSYETINHR